MITKFIVVNKEFIYTGAKDNTIKKWIFDKKPKCTKTFRGHTNYITDLVEIDNQNIASSSKDRSIKVWDTSKGACLFTLEGHTRSINCMLYNKELKRLVSGSFD